jgi:hypothetical protein
MIEGLNLRLGLRSCLHVSLSHPTSLIWLDRNDLLAAVQVVEPKRLTLAQLKEYDGSDAKKPILLAIRGTVFDVSKGRVSLPVGLPTQETSHRPGCPRNYLQLFPNIESPPCFLSRELAHSNRYAAS